MAIWRNWYTQETQNLPVLQPYGFESHYRYFLKLWINSVISKTLELGWAIVAVYYFFNGIIETGILCLILSSTISIQRNLTPKK